MKICSKCKISKSIDCFGVDKSTKDGVTSQCKECRNYFNRNSENAKKLRKDYKSNNKEHIKKMNKIYYEREKVKILKKNKLWVENNKDRHRELTKRWANENKEKIKEYTKRYRDRINKRVRERRASEPLFRMRRSLSTRTNAAFKSKSWIKDGPTETLIGCDYLFAKKYIESKFTDGMSWDNHGEWHIDHIHPLSIAKTKEELISLCKYTNLQPLWASENISKGNNIHNE